MKHPTLKMNRIAVILVTHLHGDHCFGIFGLLCTMGMLGRSDPVTVVAPTGMKRLLDTVFELTGSHTPYPIHHVEMACPSLHKYLINSVEDPALSKGKVEQVLGVMEVDTGEISSCNEAIHTALRTIHPRLPLAIQAFPLTHSLESFGFVLQEPRRRGKLDARKAKQLGATGKQLGLLVKGHDVGLPDGRVVRSIDCLSAASEGGKVVVLQDTCDSRFAYEAAQGCQVLIHECTYEDALESKSFCNAHSTSTMAADVAHTLGAGMLILTHFSSRYGDDRDVNGAKQEDQGGGEDGKESKSSHTVVIETLADEARAQLKAHGAGTVPVFAARDFMSFKKLKKDDEIFSLDVVTALKRKKR
jgi:ribonuclease Z